MFPKGLDLVPLVEEQTRDPEWGAFAQRVLDEGPNPRNGTKSDQAHPPIHPLKYTDNLQGNERKVYEFIVRHFLACVSQDAQGHETVVEIDIAAERFSAQGLMILALNYLDVYPYEKWNAKEIPLYREGDQFEPNSIEIVAGETSAPPLLTEADLIALMEKHGIGTDATHAEHIETVKTRMYIGLRPDGRFVPGHLGMGLVEGYDSMGYEMSKPHLRAELEADLKLICEGRKNKEDVLRVQIQKYKEVFIAACRQAQKLEEALSQYLGEAQSLPENTGDAESFPSMIMLCPKCQNPMTLRTKKDGRGFYIGCTGYPNCKASIWLPDFVLHVQATDEMCQSCLPGPVKKLHFKFKPGSVPTTISNDYVGCVGGCDEMLSQSLGIRSLAVQGNATPASRADIAQTPPATTNISRGDVIGSNTTTIGSNNNRGSTVGTNASNSAGATGVRQTSLDNSFNGHSSRSFHTASALSSVNRDDGFYSASGSSVSSQRSVTASGNRSQSSSGAQSSNSRFNPQHFQTPSTSNSWNSRTPLTSLSSDLQNGGRGNRLSASSFERNHSSSSSFDNSKDIVCGCGSDALLLTVRKEGPNTGRQFYKCSGQNGSSCNFFLWADENDSQQRNSGTPAESSSMSNNRFNQPQPKNRTFSRPSLIDSSEAKVFCKCGLEAKFLTVQKQGPNNGRQFYACTKPRDQTCNFFQWADEGSTGNSASSFGDPNGFGPGPFQPRFGTGGQAKRKRSGADETEGGVKQRKAPTCGLCGQPGHKKPKCPERSRF